MGRKAGIVPTDRKPERTLVLVDKAKLVGLRAALTEAVQHCHEDSSRERMVLLLGTVSSVLDGVLSELTVRD